MIYIYVMRQPLLGAYYTDGEVCVLGSACAFYTMAGELYSLGVDCCKYINPEMGFC